ncbi:MAG: hypothetical protein ACI9R3_002060 [Verrucomicrobiales bacterium]|jgi:hypothetical protein
MNCRKLKTKLSLGSVPRLSSYTWCLLAVIAFLAGRASVQPVPPDAGEPIHSKREFSGRAGSRPRPDFIPLNRERGVVARAESSATTTGDFLNETDPLVANKLLAELLLDLNPSRARTLFEALLDRNRHRKHPDAQLSLFLTAWGRLDGTAAAGAVAELVTDPALRGAALESIMSGWVSRDPEGAKAHLVEVSDPRERSVLRKGIVRGLATTDPGAAMEFATRSMGADASAAERSWGWFSLNEDVREIASVQVDHGTLHATEWAAGLPDGPAKAIAFKQVAEALVRGDPLEAARWVEAHAEEDYAADAVRRVALELARNDPMEAIHWANGLSDQSRNKALQEAVHHWTTSDPVAASEYLADMPSSSARDVAVGSFAGEFGSEDPQIAAAWAGWIEDDALRVEALETVARTWLQGDPHQARQWLSASDLSVESQEQVIAEADFLFPVTESED